MSNIPSFSKLFPDTLSRWLVSLAAPAGVVGASAVHWLSQYFPATSNVQVVFYQAIVFLILATLVMVLSNCAALIHIANQPALWPVERYAKLSMDKRVLLALLSISEPTTEKIAEQTLMSKDAVDHWINHHRNECRVECAPSLKLTSEGHRLAVVI